MKKDEALKLALEALDCALSDERPYIDECDKAIASIKEALAQPQPSCTACEGNPSGSNNPCAICGLAQPEQSPVSGVVIRDNSPTLLLESDVKPSDIRLYTSPPQRKPLTDEQRREVYKKAEAQLYTVPNKPWLDALIEQTEIAHGIKGDA